jgi:hypothetical protein
VGSRLRDPAKYSRKLHRVPIQFQMRRFRRREANLPGTFVWLLAYSVDVTDSREAGRS